jgi:hypothetical protein
LSEYQFTEQQMNSKRTASEQQVNTNNNVKNVTNVNKEEYISKLQKDFYNSIGPFIDEFGLSMVNDFYEYWSEPNKSKTKIRWQMEKTWDIKRRLQRWQKNDYGKISKNNFKSDTTRRTVDSIARKVQKYGGNN